MNARLLIHYNMVGELYNRSLLIYMTFIKLAYIWVVSEMLPEDYMFWSFDKHINYNYVPVELLPFMCGMMIYLRFFKSNAYTVFSTIFFIMSFIPANSSLSLSNYPIDFYLCINIYSLLILYFVGKLSAKEGDVGKNINVKLFIFENKKFLAIFRVLMILSLSFQLYRIYQYNGLDIMSIFISSMYDVRAEYSEYFAENTGTLYTYLSIITSAFTSWFLFIFVYYSFLSKSLIDIIFSIFTVLALFSMQMMKSTLFAYVIVGFAIWATQKNKLNKLSIVLVKAIILVFVLSIVEYLIFDESIIFSLVIRRTFYVTNYMEYCHYDFFANHNNLWFTQDFFGVQNIMSKLFGRFYPTESVVVISNAKFEGLLPAPNSGLFAEAFAQLGYIGFCVFALLQVLVIKLMYNCSKYYGDGVAFIILVKLYLLMVSVYVFASVYIVPIIIFVLLTHSLKKYIKYNG